MTSRHPLVFMVALALGLSCLVPATASAGRPDVVLVILDEFPADSLLGRGGRVDPIRYPGFAALTRSSTWFPNATTIYDRTSTALPAILEGRPRSLSGTSRDDLFRLLTRRGYSVRALLEYSPLKRFCHRHGCRVIDDFFYALDHRVGLAHRALRSIRRHRRPTLWVEHWLLPHGLWLYLPSGRAYERPPTRPLKLLAAPAGFHDRFLTGHLHQRQLLQIAFTDRLIRRLVGRLKRTRLWARTLLVVTSDHGISFERQTDDRRAATLRNLHEIAPVPLFIKYPGQRRGHIDRSLVRTTDVLPTIANALRLPLSRGVTGRPAGTAAVRRRRSVVFTTRAGRRLRVSGSFLARRRRASVRHRLRLFGAGSWSNLYRWGSPRWLLGRSSHSLGAPASGVTAVVSTGLAMRHLSRRSRIWPTLVSGTIEGGGGELRRLAVGVNGRIRAVGRSFRLRGRSEELYALMIPETALRPGRNTLTLFEVGRDRRLRRLALTR